MRDGRILGRGWTQPGGRPHAERRALDQAGEARGATAYVTLEPCAHHGQTPPCAEALVKAGVARVVTALTDPDPRVSGKGHALLRADGVLVTEGVLHAEAQYLNAGFLKRVTLGLPRVTLKLATTLDGRIATHSGESRWITGSAARRFVHMLRLTHDAVMVGSGTALADDPDLTAREVGATHQPVRIVLDRSLALATTSRLGRTAHEHPVWLVHAGDAPAARQQDWAATGARLMEGRTENGHLDLKAALSGLAAQGLTRILCEGGGILAAALLRAGLVDEVIHISAGKVIGGDGTAAIAPLGLRALSDAPAFQLAETRPLGADTLSRWLVA